MEFGPRALGGRSILGRPRSPDDAIAPESESEISRIVSSVRALGSARGCGGLVRARRRQPLHAAGGGRRGAASHPDDAREKSCSVSISSICRAPRSRRSRTWIIRPAFKPSSRNQSALSRVAVGLQGTHGCPVLVNTSFNVRGEPIVATPEDAFRCFMGTEIEVLATERCLLRKEEQDPRLKEVYAQAVEPD